MENALAIVQAKLKAPKSQFNNFGKYHYRSCEDILEAVKPILAEMDLAIVMTDNVLNMGNRFYVRSEASLVNSAGLFLGCGVGFAREAEEKKGMDAAQITGAASSYARKYALAGLLAIDDTKDVDGMKEVKSPTKSDPIPKGDQVPYRVTDLNPEKPKTVEGQDKGKDKKVDPELNQAAKKPVSKGDQTLEGQLSMFEETFPGSKVVKVEDDQRIIEGSYNTPTDAPSGVLYFEREANKRFLAGVGSAETLDAFVLELQKTSKGKGKGKTLDQLKASVMEKDGFEKVWTLYIESLPKTGGK